VLSTPKALFSFTNSKNSNKIGATTSVLTFGIIIARLLTISRALGTLISSTNRTSVLLTSQPVNQLDNRWVGKRGGEGGRGLDYRTNRKVTPRQLHYQSKQYPKAR